jgi:hypothetical protein
MSACIIHIVVEYRMQVHLALLGLSCLKVNTVNEQLKFNLDSEDELFE